MPLPRFCPSCGAPVAPLCGSTGRCTGCGRSVFANSKPAAGVFIEREGRVLLLRRCEDPARGRWDIPGGFLDEGEDPEAGARREIREELGIELGPLELFFVEVNRTPDVAVLDILYRAAAAEGEPRPSAGAASHAWFAADELPRDLAFPWTGRLLERWRAARSPSPWTPRSGSRLLSAMTNASPATPSIGVLVDGMGGARQILLIQRSMGPAGWDIPSGAVPEGEALEDAARRILREQTGLEAGQLWPVFRGPERPPGPLLFQAPDASGTPSPQCRWFPPSALPPDFVSGAAKALVERWVGARWGAGLTLEGYDRPITVGEADLVTGFGPPWEPGRLPAGTTPELGQWTVEPDEIAGLAVSGFIDAAGPTALWFDAWVDGNQLLLFAARTVPPFDHDINSLWEGSGHFDPPADPSSKCTVSGFGGWYANLCGVEQYPEGTSCMNALAPLEPGRIYYIASGRYGESDFTFVDGVLATQIDHAQVHHRRPRSRVAVSTWGSHIHYLRAWVYQIPRPPAVPVRRRRLLFPR